jgi:hypothetical protein
MCSDIFSRSRLVFSSGWRGWSFDIAPLCLRVAFCIALSHNFGSRRSSKERHHGTSQEDKGAPAPCNKRSVQQEARCEESRAEEASASCETDRRSNASSGTAYGCADSCGRRSHGILFKVPRLRRYRTIPNKATLIKIKVLVTTKSFLKIVRIILVSRAGRSVAACISRWLTCSAIRS